MSAAPDTAAKPEVITFTEAFSRALHDAMEMDPTVITLGEDIGDEEGGGIFKVTKGLSTKFGTDRVKTTPISEQAIIGAAIGASLAGMRPIAEIMLMNFITVPMDQIVNHAAKLRFMSGGQTHVPITIRTRTGAGAGTGGQHSDMLEAWFAHVAGMKVVVPSTPADAYGLLLGCIFDNDPCLFIEDQLTRTQTGPVPVKGEIIKLGKAHVAREGKDVSVIGYGRPIRDAMVLAEKLAGEGISVEVVDLRTVSPLDTETVLKSVAKTGRAVVIHEAPKSFGCGAEVVARIQEALYSELKAPVLRVASRDVTVPFSRVLEAEYLYQASGIEAAIRKTLEKEGSTMSTEVRIPQIGFSTQEGTLTEWLVADGGKAEAGKPLFTLELDKSVQEVESPATGTLKIHAAAGEVYQVGALIAEIL